MHDKLGRRSAGGRADRQVVFPHQEGAKTWLELHLRHKQTTAGILNQTPLRPQEVYWGNRG
jgi:hypothetical protein